MPKWYQSKVCRIEDASPTTKRFFLKVDDEELVQFKAGQFITCDLPISDKRQKRWRSYSIANAPDGSNIIELCIVYLEEGLGSEFLWGKAEIGTEIKFKEPAGTFVLPRDVNQDIVMVCTGTGVAPFRSMLHEIFDKDIPHQKLHLIFGTRHSDGILYQDEFEDMAARHPEFTYDIALSREKNDSYHHGYVHDIYMHHYQKDVENKKFMLCGWTGMVDEAVAHLINTMKVDKTQVIYELYG